MRKSSSGSLESDTLVFHCNTCDTDWSATVQEIRWDPQAVLEKIELIRVSAVAPGAPVAPICIGSLRTWQTFPRASGLCRLVQMEFLDGTQTSPRQEALMLSRFVLAAALTLLSTPFVHAQLTSSGAIAGQVTDAQDAAIPNVTVSLRDTSTSATQTATTNDAGRYIFLNLPSGVYDVTINRDGFKQTRFAAQRVLVGSTLTLDVKLEVGSTATSVEVQANPTAELQTTAVSAGTTITGQSLMVLPTLGRDANAFVTLQPGVAPGGEVAGKSNDQNMFTLDGGNISSDQDGKLPQLHALERLHGPHLGRRSVGRRPHARRKRGRVPCQHQQSNRRFQRRRRRPGANGHQARHQSIPRIGVRVLLRLELQRQHVDQQSHQAAPRQDA
jgi:hypothetical protein